MHVVSRAGDRPESVQALFSAVDSCSYPSISVDDLSSSNSSNSPQIKPLSEEEKCLSPSDFVCLSPVMSSGSHENEDGSERTELERLSAATPRLRTEQRAATDGSDSGEACSSSGVLDGSSQSRRSPGVNGQHRTVAPCASENLHVSSESEEEDTRPQREKVAAQSALKRTHVVSEEGESGSSPSEKKLKT